MSARPQEQGVEEVSQESSPPNDGFEYEPEAVPIPQDRIHPPVQHHYMESDSEDEEAGLPPLPPVEPLYGVAVKQYGVSSEQNPRFRRTMEDGHSIFDSFMGDPNTAYFGVYDGHAGDSVVKVVESVMEKVPNFVSETDPRQILTEAVEEHPDDIEQALRVAFAAADKAVIDAQIKFGGATISVAYVRNEGDKRVLYAANAGDARTILCRGTEGKALRMTYDHTASDPSEQDRIKKMGGFIVYGRVNALLAVTRSLGDHMMKECVVSDPFTKRLELDENDHTVVVACDGLYDVLEDQTVMDLLAKCDPQRENAQHAANTLIREALVKGTMDNITCIVVYL